MAGGATPFVYIFEGSQKKKLKKAGICLGKNILIVYWHNKKVIFTKKSIIFLPKKSIVPTKKSKKMGDVAYFCLRNHILLQAHM
jgi:hypothetical protein